MTQEPIDFGRSGVSRYRQLGMHFRRKIESGEWPVGEQIPTVDQLATEFGVARSTVRQSFDLLERDGLVERLRAKGTFVRQQPQQQLWCEVPTDWSGLLLGSPGAVIEVLDVAGDQPPPLVQHDVGTLAPSYRRWRRRHLRQGQPYYLGDAFIDERLASRIPSEALETQTSLRVLKNLEGLVMKEVHQTLRVGAADVAVSKTLALELNAPVVYAHRTAVDIDGTIVFVGDGVYRGDVIRLDIRVVI